MVIRTASSVSEWEALASATFVPVRVKSAVESFTGTMDHRGDDRWGVTSVRSGAGRVSRTAELLSSSPDDVALFSLQIRGASQVEQEGRQGRVQAGDGVLYLTRSAYELTFPQAGEFAILQVPSETLGLRPDSLAELAARPLHLRQDAALRTYSRVIRSLFTDRPVIADPDQAVMVATEILAAVFRYRRRPPARSRSHAAIFAALDRAVHERLDDPRLDVPALGAAENLSTRTVHQVFAERGTTPAAHIRAARLHRARRLLESTHLTVLEIAVRCGSTDPSVFSRAFRTEVGLTPSEYRRRARLGAL
jgi:AraC-like DNA-binding protein